MRYFTNEDGIERIVDVDEAAGRVVARLHDGGRPAEEHVVELVRVRGATGFSLLLDGRSHPVVMRQLADGVVEVTAGSRTFTVTVEDERTHEAHRLTGHRAGAAGPTHVTAVMPGIVREVRIAVGDAVEAGQPLVILEAMKMQNEVRAPRAGRVEEIHVAAESVVAKNDLLVVIDDLS